MQHVRHDQAQDEREGGDHFEVKNRLESNAPDLLQVFDELVRDLEWMPDGRALLFTRTPAVRLLPGQVQPRSV